MPQSLLDELQHESSHSELSDIAEVEEDDEGGEGRQVIEGQGQGQSETSEEGDQDRTPVVTPIPMEVGHHVCHMMCFVGHVMSHDVLLLLIYISCRSCDVVVSSHGMSYDVVFIWMFPLTDTVQLFCH